MIGGAGANDPEIAIEVGVLETPVGALRRIFDIGWEIVIKSLDTDAEIAAKLVLDAAADDEANRGVVELRKFIRENPGELIGVTEEGDAAGEIEQRVASGDTQPAANAG